MPEVSGTTLIRRALNQAHRRSIPALARELGISVLALETFAANDKALLGPRVLDHLANRLLGGGATYDHDQNLVRMAAERPTSS